jgi:hypothetical protein
MSPEEKKHAIDFAEWLREGDYNPRDKSGVDTWMQFGSKIGWLQPGHSIIHTTAQLYTSFIKDQQDASLPPSPSNTD